MKKKKFQDMNHEEAFFHLLDCAKLYYEWSRSDEGLPDRRTAKGKMTLRYALYIDKLHEYSMKEGVTI